MIKHMLLSVFTLLCINTFCAAEATHLFILSGQSNMAGMKPEESFIPTVQKEFGAENVVVIKDAVGGQPIRRWYKKWKVEKGQNPEQIGDLYDRLMTKVKADTKGKKLASVTFLWMQGERDAREKLGDVYTEAFNGVLDQIRSDLGVKDLNYVIGRLSDFDLKNEKYPHWTKMRKVLVGLADASPRGGWIDTDDLNDGKNRRGKDIKDDLHMSSEGYKIMGKRFADKAIELIKKNG